MASITSVSHELKSLQAELAAGRQTPTTPTPLLAPPATAPGSTASAAPDEQSPDEQEVLGYLRELVNEATRFFEEAEKNISAHPAESVVGALLAGIVIGRLLGRR